MNRNVRFWLLLAAALVVVVLIVGGSGSTGPPYDPRSVAPDGAKGIVETLERLGAQVDLDTAVPGPSATTALLLQDRLTPVDQAGVREWVRSGGVLVVADVRSSLAADTVGAAASVTQADPSFDRDTCTIAALAEAERLSVRGRLLDAVGRDSCFGDGNRAFVVAESLGAGTVVTIGGPDLFINSELDDADAAVVAVSLLAPNRGDAHVAFVGASIVDFGEEGLTELVPPRVWNAILQLLAAFLLYALYRSRRLGGVVAEPVPVRIEGSELVLKAGLLSERAKDPTSAAVLLRSDVMRRARKALSITAAAEDRLVAEQIAIRSGLDVDEVLAALFARVETEADLIRAAQSLDHIDEQLYEGNSVSKASGLVTAAKGHQADD